MKESNSYKKLTAIKKNIKLSAHSSRPNTLKKSIESPVKSWQFPLI